MKDRYPYQSVDPSQRDYQELLASFRQLSDERNALRSIVERLHEALEGVQALGRLGRTFALSGHSRYRRDEG